MKQSGKEQEKQPTNQIFGSLESFLILLPKILSLKTNPNHPVWVIQNKKNMSQCFVNCWIISDMQGKGSAKRKVHGPVSDYRILLDWCKNVILYQVFTWTNSNQLKQIIWIKQIKEVKWETHMKQINLAQSVKYVKSGKTGKSVKGESKR